MLCATIIMLVFSALLSRGHSQCTGGTPLQYQGNCYAACPAAAPYDYLDQCYPECPWDPATELTYLEDTSCVTMCSSGYADDYTRECVSDCDTDPIILFKDTTRKRCVEMCSTNPSEFGDMDLYECVQYCPGDTWGEPDSRLCMETCPYGHFYQVSASNRLCVSRCYPNTYADLDSVCVASTDCPDSPIMYYGDDSTNICVQNCPNNTFAEQSSQKCVLYCEAGTYGDRLSNKCVDDCPVGPPRYFGSDTTRECHLQCIEGEFADPSSGKCVEICTNNTFGDYFTRKCVHTCPEAHDTFADPLTYLCVSLCAAGYYSDNATRKCVLPADCSDPTIGNPLSRKCVNPDSCPIGYYVYDNDGLCVRVCPSPLWWGNMDTGFCMSFCEWNPPSYVSWKDDTTRRCVEECPKNPRRFSSNASGECVPTCPEGQFGSVNTFECVTTCPEGFHAEMVSNLCVSDCTSADDLVLYYYQPNITCISGCPEGYYADNTTLACVTVCPELSYAFDDNNTCLWECPDTWFADDHSQRCLKHCSAVTAFYADDSTNMCVKMCPVVPDYFGEDLNDGNRKCVSECTLTSQYADPITRTCVRNCNVKEGYFGYQTDRRCYLRCPAGWGNPTTTKCTARCPQSPVQMFGDNLTLTCVKRCPNTTYGDLSTEICMDAQDCPDGYFGDDETGRCVNLCSRLLNLFGDPVSKKCVKSCPAGLYADNTSRLCVDDCNATSNTYKDPSTKTCVNLCPVMPDLYAETSTMTCVPDCLDDKYALAYNTSVTQTRKCVSMCPSSPVFLADEQNKKCVRKCANETYKFVNNTYRGCLQHCPPQIFSNTYSVDLFEDNTTWSCVQVCPGGYYAFKHPNNSTVRKCVKMCEMVDSTYYYAEENTRKCVEECPLFKYGTYGDRINFKCSRNCMRQQFRDKQTKQCTYSCTEGTYADNTTWYCVEKCPPGYFAEEVNNTCVKHCPKDTFGYTWSRRCEDNCTDNWRYFADNTSWLCVKACPEDPDYYSEPDSKECVVLCPEDKFADPVTQRCVRSVNCPGDLVADPVYRKCVERCTIEPMYFAMNDTQLCGPDCFDGLFADNVTGYCVEICPSPYYGVNSSTYFYCVQYCPALEYMYEPDRICLSDCPEGYFADPLTMSCVEECPDDYYGNRDDNTCIQNCTPLYRDDLTKQCEPNCTGLGTANNNTFICSDQCDYGEYQYNQVCYSDCTLFADTFADNLTRKCLEGCPEDPLTFANPLNQQCVFVCPPTLFGYVGNRTCLEDCPDGLFKQLDLHLCMEVCPENQYADPFNMTCVDDCEHAESTYINYFNNSCMEICPEDPDLYGLNEVQCVERCPEGLYAENFTRVCIDVCPNVSDIFLNESWADELTHRCVQRCSALSYAFTNETHNLCLNQCPGALYASELEQACVDQCPVGTFAHQDTSRCVDRCPGGEYADNISRICVSDCSSIQQFKDDSTNWCVEECPDIPSMYAQSSTNSCVLVCADSGYFAYIENRTCLNFCPEPYFEDSSTARCVLECPIHEETYADEFLRRCVSSCDNHTLAGNANYTIFYADRSTSRCVDQCPEFPQRRYGVNDTNTCDEVCPAGTLGDNDTRICLDKCVFDDPKFTWADYNTNFCVTLCPVDFFADNRTFSCVENCTFGTFSDNSTRRCVVTCPVSPVSYGQLPDRTCVYNCSYGQYADESTRMCVDTCPANYYHLSITHKCVLQCTYPTYAEVSSRNCVRKCQDGYYGNLTTHKCELCKTECVTCTALLECTSCAEGFYLSKYSCVTKCPEYPVMEFAHLQSSICFVECPAPYFGQTNTGLCQLSCPVLYYGSLFNRTCTMCPTGCFTCDVDGCYSCVSNYTWVQPSLSCSLQCNGTHPFFFANKCYLFCPDGTFLDVSDLVTCLKCSNECATCDNAAANCTKCAYKFFYLGNCVDACPTDFFVNEDLACTACSEFPDRCVQEPLTYKIEPFTKDYKLHAFVIFNRVVDISLSEFSSIVQMRYNGKAVKASEFTVQFYNKTTYWVTFKKSQSLNENSLSIGFQPGSIMDMSGNILTVNDAQMSFQAQTGVTEELANKSAKIQKSTNIFSWMLLAVLLALLAKNGYPFLIAIEAVQIYYLLIFVRISPAPYLLVKFLDSMKYLHFLFLPHLFPKLSGYNIPEYNVFLTDTSFLYNCSPFIFVFGFCVLLFLLFTLLKSKKVIESKRIRRIAKQVRRYRLKYMIFHDALWVTYLYTTFMALLQVTQASLKSTWDAMNIVLAVLVLLVFAVFTILMVYLGNKYKHAKLAVKKDKNAPSSTQTKSGPSKIPTKYSFLKLETEKFPMEMPLRYIRKFFICVALVLPYPDAQSMLLVMFSLFFLIYLLCYMPAESKLTNWMNIAIETSYIILAGMLYGYDKLTSKNQEEQNGFAISMIVIICLMMLSILGWVVYRGVLLIKASSSWAYIYKKLTENTDPEYLREQQRKRDLEFDWGQFENRSIMMDDKTDHNIMSKTASPMHQNNLDEKFNIFQMGQDSDNDSDDGNAKNFISDKIRLKSSEKRSEGGNSEGLLSRKSQEEEGLNWKEASSHDGSAGEQKKKFLPSRTQEIGKKKKRSNLEIREDFGFDIDEIQLSKKKEDLPKSIVPPPKKTEAKNRAIWDDIEFDENEI